MNSSVQSMAADASSTGKVTLQVISWFLTVSAVLIWIGFAIGSALYKPYAISMFEDFDTELPGLTILVLQVTGLPALSVALVVTMVLIAKEFIGNILVKMVINVLALLAGLLVAIATAIAFWLPHVKVMQSLASLA